MKILFSKIVVKGAPRPVAHQSLYCGASPGKDHALSRKNTSSHYLFMYFLLLFKLILSSFISHLFIFIFVIQLNLLGETIAKFSVFYETMHGP